MLTITRKLEFDAGHRIPDHNSQCRNLHGHRYTLLITLAGEVVEAAGRSDNGMLMDFSDVKSIARQHLVDLWDHAFLVYRQDHIVREFLEAMPDHKTVVLERVPTVENLARIAFDTLEPLYAASFGCNLRLTGITLYETPNCWAEITA